MWTLIIVAVAAYLTFSHFKKKKAVRDSKKWSVEHRDEQARSSKRIRWKDLT